MSTPNKNTNTNKSLNREKLIALYMDYVLENEKSPRSVYKFCKVNNLKEDEFYNFFGSFESLQKGIWEQFFDHTDKVLKASPEFSEFTNREKMLSFYYTFFEMLSANRSYVLLSLKQYESKLKNLEQLKGLRKRVKNFAQEIIKEENETKNLKVLKQSEAIFSEAAWIQLMFLLNFWMDDNSAKFESTDVAIEKSVNTVFDVFDNTPLERVIDFGKFLWKEKMA